MAIGLACHVFVAVLNSDTVHFGLHVVVCFGGSHVGPSLVPHHHWLTVFMATFIALLTCVRLMLCAAAISFAYCTYSCICMTATLHVTREKLGSKHNGMNLGPHILQGITMATRFP